MMEIVWFFTQSRWLPRFSLAGWLVLCGAAMVLRMGLTAFGASMVWVLMIAQVLHAMTFAAHHAVCIALISSHFPGRLRGRGQALFTVIGYGFTGVLGSLGGGWLSAHFGLSAVYWASLAVAVVATACAVNVWRLRQTVTVST
jgi:PPP family 3-phenylpropionic acid transporter